MAHLELVNNWVTQAMRHHVAMLSQCLALELWTSAALSATSGGGILGQPVRFSEACHGSTLDSCVRYEVSNPSQLQQQFGLPYLILALIPFRWPMLIQDVRLQHLDDFGIFRLAFDQSTLGHWQAITGATGAVWHGFDSLWSKREQF